MPFSGEMGPLLILGIVLVAGFAGGWLARRAHIPTITGNILAGIIIGPPCLNLFSQTEVTDAFMPLSTFAMALITVSVGSHLSYRRIHNAMRRIVFIALGEALGALTLVTLLAHLAGLDWPSAFVLGCLAVATAPATTLALVREQRAKGPFVKTLFSVVALDNMLCIMLFAFGATLLGDFYGGQDGSVNILAALAYTAYQFSGSFVLAMLLGMVTVRMVRWSKVHDFTVVFVIILFSAGVSEYFALSPLLTGLFLGVFLGNSTDEAARQTQALEPLELLLFSCFFTLAGVSLHLDTLAEAGLLMVLYFFARAVGKYVGASMGGVLGGASQRIWTNIGFGLVPQAGVAIGLVILLSSDPRIREHTWALIETLILGAVTINEIIGPFATRFALRRSRESNKDRRRLIEFLQEEFILVGIKATDKWDALAEMTDFYIRTHHVPSALRTQLYKSIEDRERDFTTAVGRSAAIPHGRIDVGTGIRGVLGIARHGIDFDAPDAEPVRLIMLVVTPKGYEKEHLDVMASLAQMISDEAIRTRLLAAINANDAWEIIEGEDTRNYNYFVESDTELDADLSLAET